MRGGKHKKMWDLCPNCGTCHNGWFSGGPEIRAPERSLRRGCARRACRRSLRPGCAPSSRSCRAAGDGPVVQALHSRASTSPRPASAPRPAAAARSAWPRKRAAPPGSAPGRLAAEQHVVVAVQRHEARAGNQRGELAAFVERHPRIAARMQDQRRHAQLPRQLGDVDLVEGLQRARGVLRRRGQRARARSTTGVLRRRAAGDELVGEDTGGTPRCRGPSRAGSG